MEVRADDCPCKPFSMGELTARVRALLRRAERSASDPDPVLRAGGVEIDVPRLRAQRYGQFVADFDLLVYLLVSPDVVRTRDELLAEVWGLPGRLGSAHGRRTRARFAGAQIQDDLCLRAASGSSVARRAESAIRR